MKSKLKIVVALLLIIIIGYFSFKALMNIGSRDLENENAAFTASAIDIVAEFSTNSNLATTKYLNKAIEISGKVTTAENDIIILDGKVSCQLQANENVKLNSEVTIKGRVTGYDDLLEELKLDQCLIVK